MDSKIKSFLLFEGSETQGNQTQWDFNANSQSLSVEASQMRQVDRFHCEHHHDPNYIKYGLWFVLTTMCFMQ